MFVHILEVDALLREICRNQEGGIIVAPDVIDELDAAAALPPKPVTGRHSSKDRWGTWRK
jgi:hypothetical protein